MLRSAGLLLLRLSVGGTLMAPGYPKLFGGPEKHAPERLTKVLGPNWPLMVESEHMGPIGFAAGLEKMGVPYPLAGAYLSGGAEFFGGAALLIGFKTRLVAIPVLINMGTAIRMAHWKAGFFGAEKGGFEFPLSLATGAATLGLTGPGAFSVDGLCALLRRRCGKSR